MTTTPTEFFQKNMKWLLLAAICLLMMKTVQSCSRKMQINAGSKQYIEQIDSLQHLYNGYYKESQDSIKKLNFELRIAEQDAKSANERATAVQTAVEKIKSNTTITVKGAEEVKNK